MNELLNQVFTLLGGTTVLLAGLFGFVGKIWLSRIIEREKNNLQKSISTLEETLNQTTRKLEARLQSTIHVNKVQFEHEFQVYQEVWAALVELKMATMRLRPIMDNIDLNQTEEERMEERLKVFRKSFCKFRDLVEKNKPFYSVSVYENLVTVLDKCHGESIDYEYTERKRTEYYKEARDNHKDIINSIDNTCESIRIRFQQVTVV